MKNGTRQYFNADSVYCKGTSEVTEDVAMTVPEDVDRLWLIVVPAPKKYVQHKWTEKADNAEQWPYRFQLEGTDIASRASVYVASVIDGREVSDITLTYDVNLPQLNSYDAVAVNVSGQAQALLGTAFQLQIADIAGKMVSYSSAGPAVGKIMFYPLDPKTLDIEKSGSTANGYGHWFNSSGEVCNWNNGYLYSEFSPSSLAFNIGQYPNRVKQGSDYVIGQALRYKQATGKEAIARFIFRIHITNSEYGAELSDIQYDDPTGILETNKGKKVEGNAVYDLQGRKVGSTARHGVYVINGRKVRR